MLRLSCTVTEGVFSSERLVRFQDAEGQEYAALVDASLVHQEGARTWLEVVDVSTRGPNQLIALPTMDGTRVWVRAEALERVA